MAAYQDLFDATNIVAKPDYIAYIPWETIEEKLWDEYPQFMDWMRWQSAVEEGAYVCDVRNYFYRRDRQQLDQFPHWY